MSRSAQATKKHSSSGVFSDVGESSSNFTVIPGLKPASDQAQAKQARSMSTTAPRHRTFLSPSRDYFHRRRLRRRLANLIGIPMLSVLAAYAITRQSGGEGFTLPKKVQQAPVAGPVSQQGVVLAASMRSANGPGASAFANSAAPANTTKTSDLPAAPVISGGYMLGDGPHIVTEVPDVVLHDAKRNRDVHLRVFYPNDPGLYPVIVFSHDEGSSQNCCDALTRHWATYGYVTLQTSQVDAGMEHGNGRVQDADSLKAPRDAVDNSAEWESRPRDVSFVLDSLATLQGRVPALAGKIDADHIGVGGHSMGAFTADALAGALVDLPGHPGVNFGDSRVKAVLLLSPQGPGEFGLTTHSWDHVTLPLLSVTGSLDMGANKQGPEWREIPFERSAPGDKYEVFVQGANHLSFVTPKAFPAGHAARSEAFLGYTNSASLAFWDAYLKADPKARIYLQSNALTDFSHGAAKLTRR
ncbi:MAG: hypothetical protein WA853_16370 [Candidatus Acidiferrum sp.]